MNSLNPDFLARSRSAFTSNAPLSLQGLRDRVAQAAPGAARRDTLSALDTLARLFGRDLATIRATPQAVRDLLGSKSAAQLRVSEKRYANVRSCVATALRKHGEAPQPITRRIPLTPAWQALLESIDRSSYRFALYRLAAYCSFMKLPPDRISSDSLLGFVAALEAEEIVKNPRRLLKHTIAHWNMCRRQVPGWPDIVLSSPFKSEPVSLPLEAFPQSFQDEVERWSDRLRKPDVFEPGAPTRALRPATVAGNVAMVVRFASALVHRGDLALEQVVGFAVLLEPARFKSGLTFFLDRFEGDESRPYIGQIAKVLLAIARHFCRLEGPALEEIARLCRRVDVRQPRQMTARNRERLHQFDEPMNVARLLRFPEEERARGRAQKNLHRAAKCFERALAVALFIHCTLRISNLRSIDMETDLSSAGGKRYLSIPGSRVKNKQPLEFELPDDVAELLDEYVRDYRPRLAGSHGPYLFPGQDGGPRPDSTVRHDFMETLRKRAGLLMNPHLIRSAVAKIAVERDPGLYLAVSRQLGHTKLDMTMAHYLGTEGRAAGRQINKLLRAALVDPTMPED